MGSLLAAVLPSLLLVVVGTVFAAPTALNVQQSSIGPACNGLGFAVFDTAYNFTLAAYNRTGINVNDTGAPLVVGVVGQAHWADLKSLSVRTVNCARNEA